MVITQEQSVPEQLKRVLIFCFPHTQTDKNPKQLPRNSRPDIQLQSDIETSKKAIHEQKQKAEVEDLHLQDLSYEESLKKDKKKRKGHHGVHHAG
ncbi:hypothetical protein TNIN_456311 [Trichonephila inaurata madagascariensis]|uniref:Uncharacterized protein n=1 Tax=Trichonephila inaurata madagascariensis TaxID=2747483 RepID=A0A8X7CM12_9ARAC|nr:hypothetical protein TNIN_456311 [Trichonephila inaurata madagascariensis]